MPGSSGFQPSWQWPCSTLTKPNSRQKQWCQILQTHPHWKHFWIMCGKLQSVEGFVTVQWEEKQGYFFLLQIHWTGIKEVFMELRLPCLGATEDKQSIKWVRGETAHIGIYWCENQGCCCYLLQGTCKQAASWSFEDLGPALLHSKLPAFKWCESHSVDTGICYPISHWPAVGETWVWTWPKLHAKSRVQARQAGTVCRKHLQIK